jgi:hypothetical protein
MAAQSRAVEAIPARTAFSKVDFLIFNPFHLTTNQQPASSG